QQLEAPAGFSDRGKAADDLAEARRVDVGDSRKIQQDVPVTPSQHLVYGLLDLDIAVAEEDLPLDVDDRDVVDLARRALHEHPSPGGTPEKLAQGPDPVNLGALAALAARRRAPNRELSSLVPYAIHQALLHAARSD